MQFKWIICDSFFTLVLSKVTVPLPALYNQDPHDVQRPSFPLPECCTRADHGIDIGPTIHVITAFCDSQTDLVSAAFPQSITKIYALDRLVEDDNIIRLTLSWDNTGTCARSQIQLSPSQNSGRHCQTIFRDILLGCKCRSTSRQENKIWSNQ